MSVTLVDDPSTFQPVIAPTTGDTFATPRTAWQRCANRDAYLKQRLDQGVARIRTGTTAQMTAIPPASLSTGDVFVVSQSGPYLYDSSSSSAPLAPWVYQPDGFGSGRWIHTLNALRGAAEGLPYMTNGRIADLQVKNQIVSTQFWSSAALSQTIVGGSGLTNITGASIALGTLSVGDIVDVDVTFGDVQAAEIASTICARIIAPVSGDQFVPGLEGLKLPKRFATNSAGSVAGSGRFVVTVAGTHTVRACGTAAASADIIIAGSGSLRTRVIRP